MKAGRPPGNAALRGTLPPPPPLPFPARQCFAIGPASPRFRPGGRLAQLVEQLTLNQRVVGSNPTAPTIFSKLLRESRRFLRPGVPRYSPEMTPELLRNPQIGAARSTHHRLATPPVWTAEHELPIRLDLRLPQLLRARRVRGVVQHLLDRPAHVTGSAASRTGLAGSGLPAFAPDTSEADGGSPAKGIRRRACLSAYPSGPR